MAIVKSHIPWAVKIDAFPEQSNTLTYNTFVQSPTWRNVDFTQIEDVGGTDSATNAGTYYKLFKPLRKFVFPNGTKKVYYAPWTIYKATQQVILSETSGEVKIKFTRKFTVSRLGDGVISATSSNPNIAAVSVILPKVQIILLLPPLTLANQGKRKLQFLPLPIPQKPLQEKHNRRLSPMRLLQVLLLAQVQFPLLLTVPILTALPMRLTTLRLMNGLTALLPIKPSIGTLTRKFLLYLFKAVLCITTTAILSLLSGISAILI